MTNDISVTSVQTEVSAIESCWEALETLDANARRRTLWYLLDRCGYLIAARLMAGPLKPDAKELTS